MKKKMIISVLVLILVFEMFTSFFTKLLLSALTGITDSDDLEVMTGTMREYFLPTADSAGQPIKIDDFEIHIENI